MLVHGVSSNPFIWTRSVRFHIFFSSESLLKDCMFCPSPLDFLWVSVMHPKPPTLLCISRNSCPLKRNAPQCNVPCPLLRMLLPPRYLAQVFSTTHFTLRLHISLLFSHIVFFFSPSFMFPLSYRTTSSLLLVRFTTPVPPPLSPSSLHRSIHCPVCLGRKLPRLLLQTTVEKSLNKGAQSVGLPTQGYRVQGWCHVFAL